jgi:hypothetical protein
MYVLQCNSIWTRDLHYKSHIDFLTRVTVLRWKLSLGCLLFMEIMTIHSWVIIHTLYLYGVWSDMWCDFLEMLYLINIGSAVATLGDPIQRTNMRGLMAERFRAFDLRMEGYRFEFRWILFGLRGAKLANLKSPPGLRHSTTKIIQI